MSKEANAVKGLLQFIEESPSVYHVVENIRKVLLKKGFLELKETEEWTVKPSKGYFVVRNDSSVIAFRMPAKQPKGFHVVASHSDSPAFKVKESPRMTVEEQYIKLNTEKYGGMILSTWLDRPLSVAGRVVVKDSEGKLQVKLVNVDKDLLVIPNVAIHMNRDINTKNEYNAQVDMLPLMGLNMPKDKTEVDRNCFPEELAAAAGVKSSEILGHDLFLYVREKGRILGAKGEFILSPKLDDLQCVYTSLQAFSETRPKQYINVMAVFDNEEVGSQTAQGADSTFLSDVFLRIGEALAWGHGKYCGMIAESFLISADNAHALHPNHQEKADPTNRPVIGGGIVIKYHGGQKYTTDAVSAAKFKLLCEKAGVSYQTYTNRSDIAGGSTLGNISTAHVSLSSVDVGLPQLAMHSAVETGGVRDTEDAIKVFEKLYEQ